MKKIVSLFIASLLLLAMFASCSAAGGGKVVFPSTLHVTDIGQYAFSNFDYVPKGPEDEISEDAPEATKIMYLGDDTITEIVIPEGVKSIGAYAFRKSGLTSLILRDPAVWTIKGLSKTPDKMDYAGVAAAYIKNEYYTYEWYVAEVSIGDVSASGICGADE